jgi:hypothetical protein
MCPAALARVVQDAAPCVLVVVCHYLLVVDVLEHLKGRYSLT